MRFYIETLGCKVNQVESAAMATLLRESGHTQVSRGDECEACIINSCAVTGDASRQSRQTARRLRREHPDALIAICGCASQTEPETMDDIGAVLIGGSGERRRFVQELLEALERYGKDAKFIVDDPKQRRKIEELPSGAVDGRTRAMLKIQDGCDNFCSYCVIPYSRGRVRSLNLTAASSDAKRLVKQGFAEIVLTGIEISSYGKDLPEKPTLADVISEVSHAAPTARIRLGSLEPSMIDETFVGAIAGLPNLCDHFHLSLQSGCDTVLKRMRRKYATEEFFRSLTLLRGAFPDCGVTADLIAGFPGETEEEFAETLEFLDRCSFSGIHVFPYSKRPGTPAADMPEQVPNAVKKERAARARAVGERTRRGFVLSQVGRTLPVLIERRRDDGLSHGLSPNYLEIAVKADVPQGEIVPVTVTEYDGVTIFGTIN